jgi:hypothetical protein
MPHDEEALTQNSTAEVGGGFDRDEPQKSAESWEDHHLMSVKTLGLGDLRIKGDERKLNDAVKREIEGRCERLLGIAREQCTSVPKTDSTSFLENFWPSCHGGGVQF